MSSVQREIRARSRARQAEVTFLNEHRVALGYEPLPYTRHSLTWLRKESRRVARNAEQGIDSWAEPVACAWWALCENEATTTEPHPILGDVPICARCAAKLRAIEAATIRPTEG